MLNEQLASKIHVTDTDVQTYYTANKDKYVEPARAKISHILVSEEEGGRSAQTRSRRAPISRNWRKSRRWIEATKDNGGKIAEDVLKGAYVPGIGDANDINASIFAAEAPKVLDKPFKTDKGWEIVRVDEKQPAAAEELR